jgi:isopenicillin N synthase-like dioxygenase
MKNQILGLVASTALFTFTPVFSMDNDPNLSFEPPRSSYSKTEPQEIRRTEDMLGAGHDIPIVNLNKNSQGDRIVETCMQHGFFYVDNRQGEEVDIDIIKELQQYSQQFFQLPPFDKEKYAIENSKFHRGYIGLSSATKSYEDAGDQPQENYCESLGYGSSGIFKNITDEGNDGNIYPPELGAEFESKLKRYMKTCDGIKNKILNHLQPYLQLERVKTPSGFLQEWQEAFHEPMWTFRFLHYPSGREAKLTPHTDFGILTILYQDQSGGLQIHFKDQWIDVPPIPNTFVINVGDILQEWSGGQLKSTRHQVIYKGLQGRYSMGYFAHLSKDLQVCFTGSNQWISPYEHLTQKYYKLYRYLFEKVENPDDCLKGKTPEEIDAFHQQLIKRPLYLHKS